MADTPVVLITGCSTGFGRLLTETLAKRDYRVYATMRDVAGRNKAAASELEALAERGLPIRSLEMDVTDDRSVARAVQTILAEAGRIDIAVNNAGVIYAGPMEAFTAEEFSGQLDVNVLGVHRVNREVLPAMRKQGSGLLVHISSGAGRMVLPFVGLYHASKYALEALAETLRYELSEFGIDSVIVEPGPFKTALFGRMPRPKDGARAAVYEALSVGPEKFLGGFDAMLSNPDLPTDPQMVVDAIVTSIETPAGDRPLRIAVGIDLGAKKINALTEPVAAEILAGAGVAHLQNVKTAAKAGRK